MAVQHVRLCGTRVPAGVYATTPSSARGVPVESFLLDPPRYQVEIAGEPAPVPIIEAFGVTPIGVSLWKDRAGTYHLLDWVGSKSYPNVADWIEEVRAMGVSRRVPITLDFELLSEKSKILMFHSRGHIENAADYLLDEASEELSGFDNCPKKREAHEKGAGLGMCVRLYWQDVWGGESITNGWADRLVRRELPCNDYEALAPPEDVEPRYAPAMFAAFPIAGLEVVKSDDGRHADALEAASHSGIRVSLEDQ